MSGFAIHTVDSAPQAAKEILRDVKQDLGFVPNLHGTLANAPTVLEAYTTLGRILGHSSLTAFQRQVIALAVSVEADCEYCVSVHSLLAKHLVKVVLEVVLAVTHATLSNYIAHTPVDAQFSAGAWQRPRKEVA